MFRSSEARLQIQGGWHGKIGCLFWFVESNHQMHQIAQQLSEFECFYSPFYANGIEDFAARQG